MDSFEAGSVRSFLDLSQQDYIKRINELRQALLDAWDQDRRVTSIKIAIQCVKMLGDLSVIPFYPSKFVLVTDILDTFGGLVFSRLFAKASGECEVKWFVILLNHSITCGEMSASASLAIAVS